MPTWLPREYLRSEQHSLRALNIPRASAIKRFLREIKGRRYCSEFLNLSIINIQLITKSLNCSFAGYPGTLEFLINK